MASRSRRARGERHRRRYPGSRSCRASSSAFTAIDGRGAIAISTGADEAVHAITVSDTGTGIPEAIRDRVVEPFFTTKPVGEGTGLGLSITYSIAKKHGGSLELLPGKDGGTVATIRFPIPT